VTLDVADGAGMSWLHRHAEVLGRDTGEDGRMHMTVRVDPDRAGIVRAKFGAATGNQELGVRSKG
jgi:GTP-binding protein HflX